MGTFLSHLITGVVTILVVGALAWFGVPRVVQHLMADAQAVQTVKAEQGARSSETTADNARQANCAAEVRAAGASALAIAKASQPQAAVAGVARPLIGADQIKAFMQ